MELFANETITKPGASHFYLANVVLAQTAREAAVEALGHQDAVMSIEGTPYVPEER